MQPKVADYNPTIACNINMQSNVGKISDFLISTKNFLQNIEKKYRVIYNNFIKKEKNNIRRERKIEMQIYERNKGITLVALIVTIIVLLVLVGVIISIILNGGILSKSDYAKQIYVIEEEKEIISRSLIEVKLDKNADIKDVLQKEGAKYENNIVEFNKTGNIYVIMPNEILKYDITEEDIEWEINTQGEITWFNVNNDISTECLIIPKEIDGIAVKKIGEDSFRNGKGGEYNFLKQNFKNIFIYEGVESIGQYCFKDSALEYISLPKTLTELCEGAFQNSKISDIDLPSNLKIIGIQAFSQMPIKNIEIPDSVQEIRDRAFKGCSKLQEIVIGNQCKKIGSSVFAECESLQNIEIGKSIIEVGVSIAYDSPNIKTVIVHQKKDETQIEWETLFESNPTIVYDE